MIIDDNQLTAMLIRDMSEIINIVSDKLLDILREKITQEVYTPFEPAKPNGYQRQGMNGGFLGSWESNSKTMRNTIEATIESNPSSMIIDRENFIHGSAFDDYHSDIRSVLDMIINEGKSGDYFDFANPPHWWKSPRPYWDEFIKLLDSGKIDDLIQIEFKSRGIQFKKV